MRRQQQEQSAPADNADRGGRRRSDDWEAPALSFTPRLLHTSSFTPPGPVKSRQRRRGSADSARKTMAVFPLGLLALLGASLASDTAAPAGLGPPSLGFSSSVRSVCKPIPSTLSLCHGIGYRHMRIPNLLGHDSLRDAQQQSAAWLPLVSKLCHRDTKKFLCSLFAPVCLPELGGPVSPCRSLCVAVRDGCVPVMSAFGFPWPQMFNCSRFPRGTELCIPATGEQEGRTAEEVKREEALKGQWRGQAPSGGSTLAPPPLSTHPDRSFLSMQCQTDVFVM